METQTHIILACCTIHNFIRSIKREKANTLLKTEKQPIDPDVQPIVAYPKGSTSSASKKIDKFRDELAQKI